MDRTVQCPACQAEMRIPPDASETVKCKNCGEEIPVPAPAEIRTPQIPPAGRKRTVSFEAPAPESASAAGESPGAETDGEDLFVGKDFGGYCVEKRLGTGDRVDVYLAYHGELGTPVALKLLKPAFCRVAARDAEAFLAQVRQRIEIQHPNILQIRDVGRAHDRYFLATEYVDGPRLEEVLDCEGAFSIERASEILSQLAQALQVVHARGLHPCGINPFNTLLDKTGTVKASVFALAAVVRSDDAAAFEDLSVEAAQYLAPEQAEDPRQGDARADIYALGCLFFRMLCGHPPFTGADRDAVLRAHAAAPVPTPKEAVPTLPRHVADLAVQLMAKDPEARPASAEAVLNALANVSDQAPAPEPNRRLEAPGLAKLLAKMEALEASDLHLKVQAPPVFRIRGETRGTQAPAFREDQIQALLYEVLSPAQIEQLQERSSIDFSFNLEGLGRFRINAFKQRGSLSACVRRVNSRIPTLEELLLPPALKHIAACKDGMVMATGPTGSGKTTTLAVLVDLINQTRRGHVLTIEDPIEFLHADRMSIVTQREIGLDTPDFLSGLRDGLRQDPDVILIGELRDMETVETALAASETGHLVLGTLHASNSVDAITRLLNFFPFNRHQNLRQLLGNTLRAIIAQKLVAGAQAERPRVAAIELLFVNDVIRQCIMDDEDDRIPKQFEVFARQGFQSLNMSLYQHVIKGLVHREIALRESQHPKELEGYFGAVR